MEVGQSDKPLSISIVQNPGDNQINVTLFANNNNAYDSSKSNNCTCKLCSIQPELIQEFVWNTKLITMIRFAHNGWPPDSVDDLLTTLYGKYCLKLVTPQTFFDNAKNFTEVFETCLELKKHFMFTGHDIQNRYLKCRSGYSDDHDIQKIIPLIRYTSLVRQCDPLVRMMFSMKSHVYEQLSPVVSQYPLSAGKIIQRLTEVKDLVWSLHCTSKGVKVTSAPSWSTISTTLAQTTQNKTTTTNSTTASTGSSLSMPNVFDDEGQEESFKNKRPKEEQPIKQSSIFSLTSGISFAEVAMCIATKRPARNSSACWKPPTPPLTPALSHSPAPLNNNVNNNCNNNNIASQQCQQQEINTKIKEEAQTLYESWKTEYENTQIASYKTQLSAALVQVTNLNQRITTYQTYSKELHTFTKNVQQQLSDTQKQKEEIEKVHQQLVAQFIDKHNELTVTKELSDSQIDNLKKEISDLTQKNNELAHNKNEAVTALNLCYNNFLTLKKQNVQYKQQTSNSDELLRQLENEKQQLEEYKNKLQVTNEQVQTLTDENLVLKTEIERLKHNTANEEQYEQQEEISNTNIIAGNENEIWLQQDANVFHDFEDIETENNHEYSDPLS